MGFAAARACEGQRPLPARLTQDHHTIDLAPRPRPSGSGASTLVRALPRGGTSTTSTRVRLAHARTSTHRLSAVGAPGVRRPATAVNAWGMTIDLNGVHRLQRLRRRLPGGEQHPDRRQGQVIRGREMHWLRIDRYFKLRARTTDDKLGKLMHQVHRRRAMQPVMCVHCENAPCEQVCPVAATVHDEDGLNVMVYNRCIGTRYCSNNCPYKVRRFNYFDYHRREPHRDRRTLLQVSPDYYVQGPGQGGSERAGPDAVQPGRHRPHSRRDGEVHLLHAAHQRGAHRREERVGPRAQAERPAWRSGLRGRLADRRRHVRSPTARQTACEQACPSEAIVFGDLKRRSNSRVAALHGNANGPTRCSRSSTSSRAPSTSPSSRNPYGGVRRR